MYQTTPQFPNMTIRPKMKSKKKEVHILSGTKLMDPYNVSSLHVAKKKTSVALFFLFLVKALLCSVNQKRNFRNHWQRQNKLILCQNLRLVVSQL